MRLLRLLVVVASGLAFLLPGNSASATHLAAPECSDDHDNDGDQTADVDGSFEVIPTPLGDIVVIRHPDPDCASAADTSESLPGEQTAPTDGGGSDSTATNTNTNVDENENTNTSASSSASASTSNSSSSSGSCAVACGTVIGSP